MAFQTPAIDPQERDPAKVLEQIAAALERRDWPVVRSAWGDHGKASGMTPQQFAREWEPYRTINITLGRGQQEGAAGSSYYQAPVRVSGVKQDGQRYQLVGSMTLRRVNDVDGATPDQLRWHIESTTLKP